jgi:hypothetical protein
MDAAAASPLIPGTEPTTAAAAIAPLADPKNPRRLNADAAVLPMPKRLPIANNVNCSYKIRTLSLAVSAIIRIQCRDALCETIALDSPLSNSEGKP